MSYSDRDFYDYTGYIVAETDDAIGLAEWKGKQVDIWLPRKHVGVITYYDGDDTAIKKNKAIEAIELPHWLAEKKGLT